MRPLGIPTMTDRAMQTLYKFSLEPIAETYADPNSYGFRIGRSTHDAIEQCFTDLNKGKSPEWILEGDIKGCFDHISHEWLLENIPMDTQILEKWLKCGYVETRKLFPTDEGAPQGGTISPTLMNMTLDGLERGLTPAEMLDQIYRIQKLTGERVSNVVVMGSGEPLDNYDNLLVFLRMLTDENGLNISQRNVTVSTCGIVPKMYELAEEKLQITLALSLHATTDEKRRRLMPIANKYGMKELMDACRNYADKTGRRLTFEYSLVGGVNDTKEDAEELIGLAAPLGSHVNLIPVNPIKERDFVQSNHAAIAAFQKRLEKGGVNVTIRREMGRDIDGACGQLRRRHMEEQSE